MFVHAEHGSVVVRVNHHPLAPPGEKKSLKAEKSGLQLMDIYMQEPLLPGLKIV